MSSETVPAPALVVDDEPVTRLLVKRTLEGLGCVPVLEAASGIEAQQVLREHPDIALVLTDIMMPGMDGLELLRWGREVAPGAM
ncbi:MAG TPA: response regulator, partial [Ramlibacter sp.]|nr:response regulator [Ramlibacter sp.]